MRLTLCNDREIVLAKKITLANLYAQNASMREDYSRQANKLVSLT